MKVYKCFRFFFWLVIISSKKPWMWFFPKNILLCNIKETKRRKRKSFLIYWIYKNSWLWWLYILHVNKNKVHCAESGIFAIPRKTLWEVCGRQRGSLPDKIKPLGLKLGRLQGHTQLGAARSHQPTGRWHTQIKPNRSQQRGVGDPHHEHHICALGKDLYFISSVSLANLKDFLQIKHKLLQCLWYISIFKYVSLTIVLCWYLVYIILDTSKATFAQFLLKENSSSLAK